MQNICLVGSLPQEEPDHLTFSLTTRENKYSTQKVDPRRKGTVPDSSNYFQLGGKLETIILKPSAESSQAPPSRNIKPVHCLCRTGKGLSHSLGSLIRTNTCNHFASSLIVTYYLSFPKYNPGNKIMGRVTNGSLNHISVGLTVTLAMESSCNLRSIF